MNRTQALILAFGWQDGTIHQLATVTGCSVQGLLYAEPRDRNIATGKIFAADGSYAHRFYSVRFNLTKYNRDVLFPDQVGNIDFWIGVAEAIIARSRKRSR